MGKEACGGECPAILRRTHIFQMYRPLFTKAIIVVQTSWFRSLPHMIRP
jgi:hypothetical protein